MTRAYIVCLSDMSRRRCWMVTRLKRKKDDETSTGQLLAGTTRRLSIYALMYKKMKKRDFHTGKIGATVGYGSLNPPPSILSSPLRANDTTATYQSREPKQTPPPPLIGFLVLKLIYLGGTATFLLLWYSYFLLFVGQKIH